jgi:CRISPR/Cas system-associated exonuclease Cas4 (RecB family)
MSKDLKKSIRSTPQRPQSPADNIEGYVLVALPMIIIIWWAWRKLKYSLVPHYESFQIPSRNGSATEKQMSYLANLVSEQNFFRSKPISFEKWIQKRKMTGFISITFASELIQSLKLENESLRENFEIQKRRTGVGRFRGEIFVSDLRSFAFCERAAFYSSHQYPSQNLVELGVGQQVHQAYSFVEFQDPEKPARVTEFIRGQESAVGQIEWLQNTTETTLRHSSLPLSGRPDGFLHFSDGTKATIELKTVAKLPAIPRAGDFDQADVYALLASGPTKIRNESFVLYAERFTRELALHKRKRLLTEYDLAQVVAKIERAARSREGLSTARSAAQCASCGYRSICSGRLKG